MKLSPVVTFRILAVVIALYGALSLWAMFWYGTASLLVWIIPSFTAAAGLFMSRSWAQYIYYAVAFCTAAGWAWYVYLMWPWLTEQHITRLFIFGAIMVPFCAISSVILFRSFRRHAAQAGQARQADGSTSGWPLA